ncbi:MAG TPA: hypothetical protein VF553_01975 [Pyrinomonadaceae bacterium]|jgi:hypothetical protein
MRLVRVKAPEGKGNDVARLAFEVGLEQVAFHQQQTLKSDGAQEIKDVVDVETTTPTAKTFIDKVMSASFFDPQQYSIAVRQPRSIVSREKPWKITWPIVIPTVDIYEELWQFSHITISFAGRMLIGSLLLSYGMIQFNLLLMIAGLLFLPLLPLVLSMSFGVWTRQWRLVGQGALAFLVATALIVLGGVIVALMTDPPLKYREFSSMLTALLISSVVGVAAALATADDVGRREMIGLAATAQIALIPAYVGISLVFGFPQGESTSPAQRLLTFLVIIGVIVITSLMTYAVLGMRGKPLGQFSEGTAKEPEPIA